MTNESATTVLDGLVANLEKAIAGVEQASGGDAIARELASPARTTAVKSLRDSPEVAEFRQALIDGLIRVDTVNRVLQLVNEVVVRMSA